MKTWLLDTGPVVAYLDPDDPAHTDVADRLDAYSGRTATTSAVVAEAMHFAGHVTHGPRLLAEFLRGGDVEVFDFSRHPELTEAVALMERYANVPMDYADASLVLLAEALGAHDVLTLDRRGFSTFRTRRGRALRLVLDR